MRKSLLLLLPLLASAFLAMGCSEEPGTATITPEEAKAIVGEDPDYLPGTTSKKAAKAH